MQLLKQNLYNNLVVQEQAKQCHCDDYDVYYKKELMAK